MAILKIEDLYENFDIINNEYTAQSILEENTTTEGYLAEDSYRQRDGMKEFFKRITLEIDNTKAFEKFVYKAEDALSCYIKDNTLKELPEELMAIYEKPNEERTEEEKSELFEKMKSISEKYAVKKNKLEVLIQSLSYDNWKEGKAPSGTKLNKQLRKLGMPQHFLDWSSTQEKSDAIVQLTINPTIQAVAGMSNFAEEGSWNGYGGTSCQDTRLGGGECLHLLGALNDKRYYTIQLNYLEDNEALMDYLQGRPATEETLKDYDITDYYHSDILISDNMQDKLKARVNARLWGVDNIDTVNNHIVEAYRASGLEFNFLKPITYYGSNKTKTELSNALKQAGEAVNVLY